MGIVATPSIPADPAVMPQSPGGPILSDRVPVVAVSSIPAAPAPNIANLAPASTTAIPLYG